MQIVIVKAGVLEFHRCCNHIYILYITLLFFFFWHQLTEYTKHKLESKEPMLQLQNYNLLSENTTTKLIQYICIYISQPNSIVLFQKCSVGVQAVLCAGLVKFFHIVFS